MEWPFGANLAHTGIECCLPRRSKSNGQQRPYNPGEKVTEKKCLDSRQLSKLRIPMLERTSCSVDSYGLHEVTLWK